MSTCIFVITGLAIFLSITENLQLVTKANASIIGTEIFSYIGYVFRPLVLVWFIIFAKGEPKGKWKILFYAPIVICAIIYMA